MSKMKLNFIYGRIALDEIGLLDQIGNKTEIRKFLEITFIRIYLTNNNAQIIYVFVHESF